MPRRTSNPVTDAADRAVEKEVADRLRLQRGLAGKSQSDLARALGITFQQVQKYERAANRISIACLIRAAGALDKPLSAFLAGIGSGDAGDAPSGTLGRRELDLLRLWSNARPEIADAVLALLRGIDGAPAPLPMRDVPVVERGPRRSARRPRGVSGHPSDVERQNGRGPAVTQ